MLLRVRPRRGVCEQQPEGEQAAADEAAVGATPPVLVLEAGEHGPQPGEHRKRPVGAGRYPQNDPDDCAEAERNEPAENDLQRTVILVGAISGAVATDPATHLRRLPFVEGDTVRSNSNRPHERAYR